ncbi:MAG: response regulator [Deltaproteobacteria bacterium]
MHSILIADEDTALLAALGQYLLKFSDDLGVYTARNARDAIRVLETKPVDLVIAELLMTETDGIELSSYLNEHFPSIPMIMMSGLVTSETKKKLKKLGSPVFLTKPLKFEDLKDAIFARLEQQSDMGSIAGVSLTSFVQYISLEGKTCLVEARAPGKKPGCIYFNKGRPWDAIWEDMRGKEAAVEIISWEKVEINFKIIPAKKSKRRIESELIGLIIEAARCREEKAANEKLAAGDGIQPLPAASVHPDPEMTAIREEDIADETPVKALLPDGDQEAHVIGHEDARDDLEAEKLAADDDIQPLPAASVQPVNEMAIIRDPDIADETPVKALSPDGDQEAHVIRYDDARDVLEAVKKMDDEIIKSPVASDALAGFLSIPGVEAVLLIGDDGAVVQSSTNEGGMNMIKTGTSSALVWSGVAKMGNELGIYGFHSLMLESEDVVIVGAPVKGNLLVVLARHTQRLGMIRMRIRKQIPDLEKAMGRQQNEGTGSA